MEYATARQKLIITRLCMALGIRNPLEEQRMSKGEAGRLIRELIARVRTGGKPLKYYEDNIWRS
jgi:hypothetical protein